MYYVYWSYNLFINLSKYFSLSSLKGKQIVEENVPYIGKSDKEFSSDTIPSKMMRMAQSSSDETLSGKYMSYGYNYTE